MRGQISSAVPLRGALVVVAVIATMAGPISESIAAAETQPEVCAATNPFTEALAAEVDRSYAGHHVTAAVHDERTGCTHHLHQGQRVTTASLVKIEIYAGILLRAQNDGRWLTQWEADRVWPMITQSADPPASDLWSSLGGGQGMAAVGQAFGLQETTPSHPIWGLTTTTAMDQVRLVRQAVAGAYGPLGPSYRHAITQAMQSVVPSQRWGISAGVPPGWSVALKNGFFDSVCCRWRINSAGFVGDPGGGGYSVAILSDGWPNQASGVAAVEYVARAVNARLASHPYGPFGSRWDFVSWQYGDMFGRMPSVPDALPWVEAARWDSASGGRVVDGLLAFPESGWGDLVAAAHRVFLGRWPDRGGMAYWRGVIREGASPGAVLGAFADSDEFRAWSQGLDDRAFIERAYRHVFDRGTDPAGAAWWQSRLTTHGRAGVLWAMASTAEAGAKLWPASAVVQVYDVMLGRVPSPGDIAYWMAPWRGRANLAATVLMSQEYDARVS